MLLKAIQQMQKRNQN